MSLSFDSVTQKWLAEQLGIKQQAVSLWVKNGFVPPKRVLAVSKLTGIDAAKLNPQSHGELNDGAENA